MNNYAKGFMHMLVMSILLDTGIEYITCVQYDLYTGM